MEDTKIFPSSHNYILSVKMLVQYIFWDAFRYTGGGGFIPFLKLYLRNISFRYIVWMRICAYTRYSSICFPVFLLSYCRLRHLSYKTTIQIPYSTVIGPGFFIGHFGPIVINSEAIIGRNVNISPGVVIGSTSRGKNMGTPVIGDDVYIAPGAKIIGAVVIGSRVAIGANAVVTKSFADDSCVVGVPARVISMKGSSEYINRKI